MIEKILKNLENKELLFEDIEYLFLKNDPQICQLYNKSIDLNSNYNNKISLESKIFYPLIYHVESNCPTCGYRTPESHRQYNPDYIESVIKYNLDVIKSYGVNKINCLNAGTSNYNDKSIFLELLNKYDIDKAIKIEHNDDLNIIEEYKYNSLIIDSQNTEILNLIQEDTGLKNKYNIIVNLEIHNNKLKENIKFINNIKDYKIDSIEVVGYDPFYDDIHEYNPQYNKEYLKKTISILNIIYPEKELKISYATNDNNYFKDIIKLGLNTINGVYCNKTNKLFNIEKIMQIIKNAN